ncbi:hypothetical protein AN641_07440 [Candidatus Epulonipiscioides gigas]|nr:hypothetical protein AN641_07440 [Epulopiscium sp. SCG-C07WGA-EpuloA2]
MADKSEPVAKATKPTKEALQYCKELISFDTDRIGIVKYDKKMLYDPNRGHWENLNSAFLESTQTCYRDPVVDIKEGCIGINFGAKNVTVALLDENSLIIPMRIGAKDIQKPIAQTDFQIPSILYFKNMQKFIQDYQTANGRPTTKWNDLSTSHSVINDYLNSSSKNFSNFMYNLKPWTAQKTAKISIKDKAGASYQLAPFLEIDDSEFNPIELYAYYLGSFINNMHNGIYLKYILACPSAYEKNVVDKILESFTNGIKKSLPNSILENSSVMDNFRLELGIDETVSYALSALTGYEFNPKEGEAIFFSVFDMGATTTNFNYGIYKRSEEDTRFTYTVDELGVQGNNYLGGEILLEELAYEVFVYNQKLLQKRKMNFTRPKGVKRFIGDGAFISNSEEAKKNTASLMEALRPFYENTGRLKPKMKVYLYDREGFKIKTKLKIKKRDLINIIEERITNAIWDFFEFIKITCTKFNVYPEKINVFLSGNASKSEIIEILFDKISKKAVAQWHTEINETIEAQNQKRKLEAQSEKELLNLNITEEEPLNLENTNSTESENENKDEADALAEMINLDNTDNIVEEIKPITFNANMFEVFPYIGTEASIEKMKSKKIRLTENNYFATMGSMGVAFGVLRGRKGSKILVTDHSKSQENNIKFQYYIGDCDLNNNLKVLITPHTPYDEWILYTPASCIETEIYYTIFPIRKDNPMPINKARKAIIKIDEVYDNQSAYIYIKLTSPSKIEYMIGSIYDGEINVIANGEEIELNY